MPQGSVRAGAEQEVPVRSSYSVSLNNRKVPCAASLNAFAATFRKIIGVAKKESRVPYKGNADEICVR